jgi:hypothetical protein
MAKKKELLSLRAVPLSEIPTPKPCVQIKRGWVCIRSKWHKEMGRGHSYDVELARMDTPSKLLHWLWHLSGKVWLTADVVYDLTSAVADHFRWPIHLEK